ncbi:macro domain-containing protein [Cardiosporidium cionae]|uniref:Macro domain-containing protein n=1 Tax=Cardiosporidium cionae TaxID=476202 RepID=A0ABQ7J5S7_9APIC|nr:macro domain-containing protein [Cardiosporidium cionae]|eukprot:KAF8819356.1 macro domain-containing protein [Cardiosporidium cionae]
MMNSMMFFLSSCFIYRKLPSTRTVLLQTCAYRPARNPYLPSIKNKQSSLSHLPSEVFSIDAPLPEKSPKRPPVTVDVQRLPVFDSTLSSILSRITLYHGDSVRLKADALVHGANQQFKIVGGSTGERPGAILAAAGPSLPRDILAMVNQTGPSPSDRPANRSFLSLFSKILPSTTADMIEISSDKCRVTEGYDLPVKYLLHVKEPLSADLRENLHQCYTSALDMAVHLKLSSIVFPCLGIGSYQFTPYEATRIAVKAVVGWLRQHRSKETFSGSTFTNKTHSVGRVIFSTSKESQWKLFNTLLRHEKSQR